MFISLFSHATLAFDLSRIAYGNTVNDVRLSIDKNTMSQLSGRSVMGSGTVISKSHFLEPFHKIMINVMADVKVLSGDKYHFSIRGDDNIIKLISTRIVNEQLQIRSMKNYSTQSSITIIITMPVLKEIKQSGMGNIVLDNVTKDYLGIMILGSGNVYAKGKVDIFNAFVEGAGNLHLQQLKTHSAYITIEGMGSAFVDVSDYLNAQIKGMGSIYYSGEPSVDRKVQGMGRIVQQ